MDDSFDLLIELGKQIPALGVLVWLVILFLGHLKDEREARCKHELAWQSRLEAIGTSCHDHGLKMMEVAAEGQRDSTSIIRDNTRALEQVTATINAMQLRQELDRDRRESAAASERKNHAVGSV